MKKHYWGTSGIGGTLAALSLAVACGDSFGGEADCKANRTCAATGGEASDGGSPADDSGGAAAASGHDATVGGETGSGATGGDGGAAGASDGECRAAADCSNGDPADGEEVCNNRECIAGNPPPTIISVSPKDSSVDIELDAKVAIKFSEPLDAKTVTPATIRVLDGETVVPGSLEYADNVVTFTPTSPLALLAPYTVEVTTGVKDAEGAPLLSEYTSEFSTRDGAWKTVDVVQDNIHLLSNGLPISSEGDVLVASAGAVDKNCPIVARWFRRGVATGAKAFEFEPTEDCSALSSGGNAAGVTAVVWKLPNSAHGTYVQQYRAGGWQGNPSLVSKDISGHDFQVAVAPSGDVTLFEHGNEGTKVWKSDADGKWPMMGSLVSSGAAFGPSSVAYDADGNAFALWHSRPKVGSAIERIVVSHLVGATGTWSEATDLPGSVASNAATGDHLRGIPVVAVDGKGDAMALWVNASGDGKLMASRYSKSPGWGAAESISGGPIVKSVYEPPALAFDGEAFVAAWTAQEGGMYYTFTARYDATNGWGAAQRQQVTAADGTSALKMPRLVSDGRGNLLLVFAKGASSPFSLVYQRYARGGWDTIKSVPGGVVANAFFHERGAVLALSMNGSGLAALSWGNYDYDPNRLSGIRLASFY